ncbi:MAG: hypothetical protein ABIH23_20115 [bacterium]
MVESLRGLELAYRDERIVKILRGSADLHNPELLKAVRGFIDASWKNNFMGLGDISMVCGFDQSDLFLIYMSMIHELMPNPCMAIQNSEIAIPTLIFLEPHRLEELFRWIYLEITSEGDDSARLRAIENVARKVARILKNAQEQADFVAGSQPRTNTRSGCMGVVAITIFLVLFFALLAA